MVSQTVPSAAEEGAHRLLLTLEAAAKNIYDVVYAREGRIDLAIAGKNLDDRLDTARIHVRWHGDLRVFEYSYSKPPRGLRSVFGDRETCIAFIVEECQGVPWLTAISEVR